MKAVFWHRRQAVRCFHPASMSEPTWFLLVPSVFANYEAQGLGKGWRNNCEVAPG